jgi:hypothetical protein
MEALRMISIAYGTLPTQAVAVAAQLGISSLSILEGAPA